MRNGNRRSSSRVGLRIPVDAAAVVGLAAAEAGAPEDDELAPMATDVAVLELSVDASSLPQAVVARKAPANATATPRQVTQTFISILHQSWLHTQNLDEGRGTSAEPPLWLLPPLGGSSVRDQIGFYVRIEVELVDSVGFDADHLLIEGLIDLLG